jgi:hypothetical protein
MRNFKKLFAVIMVVAMLASIMVPAFAADYESDALKLKALGLFKGYSDADLGLEDILTREQGLTFMLRAKGLEDEVKAMSAEEIAAQLAKVTDLDTVTEWAKPYVAYAVKNGLTKGINKSIAPNVEFAGQLLLTGKEFINFMLNSMGYEEDWGNVLTKAADVGMLSAGQAVTFGTINELKRDTAAGIIAFAMGGTTASGVTLAQALVDAGAVDADAMAEAGYFTPTVAPTEAPVELAAEASAPNNIQINVVYNEKVEEASAQKVDNYKLSSGSIEKAVLQDDGVTVVLTLKYESAKKQDDKVDLTIKNVKSEAGVVIAETTIKGLLFLDKDIPTVVDAKVVGKDTIKVIFSEPMNGSAVTVGDVTNYFLDKDGFIVNGGKLYVKEAKLQNNYTEALVKLYSSLPEGEVTIQVKSTSEDFAGFGVIGKLITLNVEKDAEAPVVVGYENAKPTEITLIWSEDIEFDGKAVKEWYHTNASNEVSDVTIDGNKTKLTFANEKKLPPATAYVYVLKEAVKDLWGNKNAQQMLQVEVVIDETPPEVSSVKQEADSESKIVVTYNEDVDKSSAEKAANYTILDSDGKEIEGLVRSVSYASKKATLTLSKKLGGEYAVVIKGVKDIADNEIVEVTVPFTVKDISKPIPTDFKAVVYNKGEKGQMLKVSFGEAMTTEGKYAINDIDNYQFGEKTLKSIKKVAITVVDSGKAVEIVIPSLADNATDGYNIEASTDAVSKYLTVARVADAAGNYTKDLSFDVKITDSAISPVSYTAEATAKNIVKVTFAEEVKFEVSDFIINTVTDGVYKVDLAGIETTLNDKGKTVATFTLAKDLPVDFDNDNARVEIVIPSGATKPKTENKYGVKISTLGVGIKDKIAPTLYNDGDSATDYGKTNDGVKDYLLFDKDNFAFTLKFSEDMKTAIGNNYAGSDFVVTIGGKTLVNGRDYTVTSIVYNAVTFELTESFAKVTVDGVDSYKVEGDFSIKLVETTNYITDKNGNKPKAFDAIIFNDLLMKSATW